MRREDHYAKFQLSFCSEGGLLSECSFRSMGSLAVKVDDELKRRSCFLRPLAPLGETTSRPLMNRVGDASLLGPKRPMCANHTVRCRSKHLRAVAALHQASTLAAAGATQAALLGDPRAHARCFRNHPRHSERYPCGAPFGDCRWISNNGCPPRGSRPSAEHTASLGCESFA
jgi:hypothetical protein